jgi:hypothetical protein
VAGRERLSRADPPLDVLHIRLSGIPAAAGPERIVALLLAIAVALGSVLWAVSRARGGARAEARDAQARAALRSEKQRLLHEAAALRRAHEAGEIGPETYGRRKRELGFALARVLQALDAGKGGAVSAAS